MSENAGKDLPKEEQVIERIKSLRSDDVKSIAAIMRQAEIHKLRRTINYYPLRFLADGIDAYKYAFDNAAIFYAGVAVELALLVLLQDRIKREQQRTPKPRIDFKWLISHSGSLLDDAGRELCHNVRKMRNCYVHYGNIVAHMAWMEEVDWLETIQQVKAELGSDSEAMKLVDLLIQLSDDLYSRDGVLPIRFQHLETNKEVMPFIKNQYEQYVIWIPQAWVSKKQELTREEFNNLYRIEAFDALSCITWAFEVVKKLRLIG